MTGDERKALARALRKYADDCIPVGSPTRRDFLAAAAELERPRPVVVWAFSEFAGLWEPHVLDADGDVLFADCEHHREAAEAYAARALAAGFDVAALPGVDDDL